MAPHLTDVKQHPTVKKSALNRQTQLRGRSTLTRIAGLNPRSERTETAYQTRRVLVERILKERPLCETCGTLRPGKRANSSRDCHEKASRGRTGGVNGDAWLDPTNIMAVCRSCHMWITTNPREAEQLGFLTPIGVSDKMTFERSNNDGSTNEHLRSTGGC